MIFAFILSILALIGLAIYLYLQPEKQEIDLINSVIYKIISVNRYEIKNFNSSYSEYIYVPKYKNFELEIDICLINNYVTIGDVKLSKSASRIFRKKFKKLAIQMNMSKLIQ
jgi:hypothetical protein